MASRLTQKVLDGASIVEILRVLAELLGGAGLLLRVVDVGEVSDSVRRTLDPQPYGGDLLETLWQFLSADGHRHAAAQQLHGLRARGAAGGPGT